MQTSEHGHGAEPFIETASGARFHPLAPVLGDIKITDIAHALSHQCRFAGHVRTFYSVAEHSVRVAWLVQSWRGDLVDRLWALLHDASEAYLVDIPSPLKKSPGFEPYRFAERRMQNAICERFDLPKTQPAIILPADLALLATEARDLMPYKPEHWADLKTKPLPQVIEPWSPSTARARFLAEFSKLMEERYA